MKRRKFLEISYKAPPALALLDIENIWRPVLKASGPMNEFFLLLVKENDFRIPTYLQNQQLDPDHPYRGGLPDQYDMYSAGGAVSMIRNLATVYSARESIYYREEKLIEPLKLASNCLLKLQHEDGTIDLLSTNFHSTPDLAFVVEHASLSYALLKQTQVNSSDVLEALSRFLMKAGEALSVGGVHTPNHRWVICMALARIHKEFPQQKYLSRINNWLAEGIDIDQDGQYTEKSTHIYSPLTNRCLITIARLMNRPEMLLPVRKNLDLTWHFVHPDGELVTESSSRQDKDQIGTLENYFYPYQYMAIFDESPVYARISEYIRETIPIKKLAGQLGLFLEEPEIQEFMPTSHRLAVEYEQSFDNSRIVRIRNEDIDSTILAGNPVFFTFSKKGAYLQGIRLATAFFGKGQFVSDYVFKDDGNYSLEQCLQGPYYQPLNEEDISPKGIWTKAQRDKRPQSEIQNLKVQVQIVKHGPGFLLNFDIEGSERVPVAIELGFRSGGELSGVVPVENIKDAYLLSSGRGSYKFGGQTIHFGNGRSDHLWTQVRGSLPKMNALSVYITGYTPFQYALEIY